MAKISILIPIIFNLFCLSSRILLIHSNTNVHMLTENFNTQFYDILNNRIPTKNHTELYLINDDENRNKDYDYDDLTTLPSSSIMHRTKKAAMNKCEFWLISNEGNITSFMDTKQNIDCLFRVQPINKNVCSLELYFYDFNIIDTDNNDNQNGKIVEEEFQPLLANHNGCNNNYLEFNNRKRYCHSDWKNRMDIVKIDPNYEKDFVFRLVLDSIINSNGFNIHYKTVYNSCNQSFGHNYLKNNDPVEMLASNFPDFKQNDCEYRHNEIEFEIKSDNFPRNYSNNLNCIHYIVRKSSNVCGLELKFIHFDLEQSEMCANDFFEIDGENFCGHLPKDSRNIFRFDQSIKTIRFQTDSQITSSGFHIKLRQLFDCRNAFMPIDEILLNDQSSINVNNRQQHKCNIVLHEQHGSLKSLNYPKKYPNNLICTYTIERLKDHCSLKINFIDFDLSNLNNCNGDFFQLSQNDRYCGQRLLHKEKIISFKENENNLRFLFKSDNQQNDNGKGFHLNVTQMPCNNIIDINGMSMMYPKPRSVKSCEKIFTEKKFNLISESSIDGYYKENQNCIFTIKKYSNKVCYLELHFKMFDLEASQDCQYDYMEIGSAVRLCGTLNQETSRIYVFDKQEMIINFHTDSTNERKGYHIEVEQLECKGDRIIREASDLDDKHYVHHQDESKENLQSLEQSKFEQQHIQQHRYYDPIFNNDTQQMENFLHQTSEFDSSLPEWKYIPSNPNINSLICLKTFRHKEFFIHSPNFPENYPIDLDCLYMILPYDTNICKLEINFDSFELQPYDFEKNCLKSDFIDFDNKEQFCGKMTDIQTRTYPFRSNETFFIHFHSDSFHTSFDKGFRLYLRQIECSSPALSFDLQTKSPIDQQRSKVHESPQQHHHCSRIFMSPSFEIQSPLYPSSYPPNSYCDYRIVKYKTPGINVCFLQIHFIEFDLQTSLDCTKDYLSFNGIKQCGTIPKNSVRLFPFYDNEFIISFASDHMISGRGFYIKIRQNECPQQHDNIDGTKRLPSLPSKPSMLKNTADPFSPYQIYHANQICQQTFSSTYFEFESPNYPQYYLPNLSCVYAIQRRHSRYCKLELYFNDFDLEPSTKCMEDYLLIDNVKYCNSNRPNSIIQIPFYEPEKRIYFRSISFRPRKGFMIQAKQINCDTISGAKSLTLNRNDGIKHPQQQQEQLIDDDNNNSKFIFLPSLPSICEICVTEVTGHIQSYDYPNYYPPNVNCTYHITPLPDNCMAQLRFIEFDFDYSPECNIDYLEINGIRYCGHQLKDVSMILMNKRKEDLAIHMVTSSRSAMVKPSFKGFRASYTQLPCLDTQLPAPSSPPQAKPTSQPNKNIPPGIKSSMPVMNPQPPSPQSQPKTPKHQLQQPIVETIYCDQTFDDKMFEIKSPGYPYRYFNDLDCSYLIRKNSANVCRLKVTFINFNVVGEDGNCRGDYLDIFNTRFCGILDQFTSKELPFLQEKLLLHFHTNHQQTANGFHLTLEQIDCIPGRPSTPATVATTTGTISQHSADRVSKMNPNSKTSRYNIKPIHSPAMTKNSFKYDDDDIISEFDTRNKATMEIKPQVIYSDDHNSGQDEKHPQQKQSFPMQQQRENEMNPMNYFSKNITVVNEDQSMNHIEPMNNVHDYGPTMTTTSKTTTFKTTTSVAPSRSFSTTDSSYDDDHRSTVTNAPTIEQTTKSIHQKQQSKQTNKPKLCEQTFIDKVYFELKSQDLQKMNDNLICHLHVRKAKSNICQLDVILMKFNLNDDGSCEQRYLSIDGEKICGQRIHERTSKKFKFERSEIYLFVNLMNMAEMIDDDMFEIKVRQIECASNDNNRISNKGNGNNNLNYDKPQSYPRMNEYHSYGHRYPTKGHQYPQHHQRQQPPSTNHNKNNDHLNEWKSFKTMNEPDNEKINYDHMKFDPHCDLIENDMNFQIESPRDSTITRCRYTIRKANNNVCAIDIKFHMFHLNEGIKCEQEYLDIDSNKICGTHPVGHERRYPFMANEYEKVIYFISSKSLNTRGDFRLEVKQIDSDCDRPIPTQKPSLTMPTVCDISVRNYRGQIKSPNYPAPYGDFTKCVYRIQAISNEFCHVKLRIKDMDIESSSSENNRKKCDKDWLEIDSQRLCGNKLEQTEYTIPFDAHNGNRIARIKFTSDAFGNGRGFDIEYKQELCNSNDQNQNNRMKTNLISPSLKGFRPPQIKLIKGDPYSNNNNNNYNIRNNNNLKSYNNQQSMRPQYPPNYVSKAHLLKTMDRKEFIKMMLLSEQEQMKTYVQQQIEQPESEQLMTTTISSLNNNDDDEFKKMTLKDTITTISPPSAAAPTTTTSINDNMVISTIASINSDEMTTTASSIMTTPSDLMITTESSIVTINDVDL